MEGVRLSRFYASYFSPVRSPPHRHREARIHGVVTLTGTAQHLPEPTPAHTPSPVLHSVGLAAARRLFAIWLRRAVSPPRGKIQGVRAEQRRKATTGLDETRRSGAATKTIQTSGQARRTKPRRVRDGLDWRTGRDPLAACACPPPVALASCPCRVCDRTGGWKGVERWVWSCRAKTPCEKNPHATEQNIHPRPIDRPTRPCVHTDPSTIPHSSPALLLLLWLSLLPGYSIHLAKHLNQSNPPVFLLFFLLCFF
jgi:hypothetical protein